MHTHAYVQTHASSGNVLLNSKKTPVQADAFLLCPRLLRQICSQFEGNSFWLSLPVSSEVPPEGPGGLRDHPRAPSSPQPCWQPPVPQVPLHVHAGKPSPPAPLLLPWPRVPHLKSPPGQRLSHVGPEVALLQLTGGAGSGHGPTTPEASRNPALFQPFPLGQVYYMPPHNTFIGIH